MANKFNSVSEKEWLENLIADQKGRPVEDLKWNWDGNEKVPIFHADKLKEQLYLGNYNHNQWEICQPLFVESNEKTNAQALEALNNGANSIYFIIAEDHEFKPEELFDGIQLEWISANLHFKNPDNLDSFFHVWNRFVEKNNLNTENISFSINGNKKVIKDNLEMVEKYCHISVVEIPIILDNQNASKNLAQAIYKGSKYFEIFEELGIDKSRWNKLIKFKVLPEDDFDSNIIQIRSLKSLWLQIQKSWGIKELKEPQIEAHLKNKFSSDVQENMVRSSIHAISIALSSVQRLVIYPADYNLENGNNTFSRRIALNINHLLKNESYLDTISDPVSGSYFFDSMSFELCQNSWFKFQQKFNV